MPDVARMLGVEIGEEFDVKGSDDNLVFHSPYHIGKEGLVNRYGDYEPYSLEALLVGTHKISKKPWKPKMGERYYYIEATLDCNYIEVWQETWKNTTVDMERYIVGNFFKTREEAEANVDRFLEHIKQEPDLSWRIE